MLYFTAGVLLVILWGCAPQEQIAKCECPGSRSAAESLSNLELQSEKAVSVKANGQCLLHYYDEEAKLQKENFAVKLWVNPPSEIYLQGDVGFNGKGIVLGSNAEEFWLAIRPKEISGYWWGKWDEQEDIAKVVINPKVLLEAVGVSEVSCRDSWSLSKEGGFDVLTKRNGSVESRKVYVDTCDYLVRRIEYFDLKGQRAAFAELDSYKEVVEGFSVPCFIRIVNEGGNSEDTVEITLNLKPAKKTSFNEKQQAVLFGRPEPRGFEHVYKIVGDDTLEQTE
ncbi:MAG: hypothetical protein MUO22_07150 [Sedimentisphaerales bacterium]|nr:hypothetical protein [Sedimentisphaerales bacterium]